MASRLNPEIWKNKTLGSAVDTPSLIEVEAQVKEDRAAKREGREPREAKRVVNYPKMRPSGSVPSSVKDEVVFVGDTPGEEDDGLFSSDDFE